MCIKAPCPNRKPESNVIDFEQAKKIRQDNKQILVDGLIDGIILPGVKRFNLRTIRQIRSARVRVGKSSAGDFSKADLRKFYEERIKEGDRLIDLRNRPLKLNLYAHTAGFEHPSYNPAPLSIRVEDKAGQANRLRINYRREPRGPVGEIKISEADYMIYAGQLMRIELPHNISLILKITDQTGRVVKMSAADDFVCYLSKSIAAHCSASLDKSDTDD